MNRRPYRVSLEDLVTVWDSPTAVMPENSHGAETYREWCRAECDRIRRAGQPCRVIRRYTKRDGGKLSHPVIAICRTN